MQRKPSRPRQAWIPRLPNPNPNPNPNPDSRHGRGSQPQSSSEPSSIPQLVQEIQDKLSRGAVECMICYDNVRRSAPIWSCSSCYSLFHLHCIRKWARSPTSGDSTSAATWRCPGCQSIQAVKPEDLSYICFCGSRRDPPNDLYLTPHSCGEPCRKPLDRGDPGENEYLDPCPHVCVLPCHPGPCPPCTAFAPRRSCPCGKKTVVRRCSDRTSPLTCGQVCGRLLSCGRHRCEKICHTGACSPCRVLITASCFCAKKLEVVLCGDMAMKGEVRDSGGFFSCDSNCGKRLACGNHDCCESCHPGPCGDCELLPEKIKTCHCGKTPLLKERESCLDPIPTCSQVCAKLLPCGVHQCGETCHAGDCPHCLAKVEQKCRCGSSTRTVECFRMSEEKNNFVCEKPCGKKKGCGRHRCNEKCCPLSKPGGQLAIYDWDPHLCSIPCGKRLQCGQHSCQLLCHSGHCPPCLETIFTDLTCACGKTSIPPPLPCGTLTPSCPHPCLVPQPCGHSAAHTCHFGDCPPCSVPVVKECIGGHVLLRNIPCGSKDIRCNQLCGKTRQCGLHACSRTCHPPPCDSSSGSGSGVKSSCGQVCGAPRRDCKHTCMAACHPSASCPDLRCEFPVTISCSCGRITASVPCGAGGMSSGYHMETVFESSVIQKLPVPLQPVEADGKKVPLGLRKLTCDEECAKMERKRVLADAFDITPNLEALHFGENASTSELLSDLLRREPKFAMAAEERFKFLVMGKPKGSSSSTLRVHVFCHMVKEKRDAIKHLAERWKLAVHSAGWEPKRFVVVYVTPKSKPPSRILGAKPGVPVTAPSHPPVFDPLIDMDPRLVVSMLDLPRDADINALVLRFGGECEMVWLNNKNALAVFNDPMRSATALRRLDHGSAYHGAIMVLPNGGASGQAVSNAWGLVQKEGTVPAKSSSNPWKKALATESESWGDATLPHWRGNEVPPIAASPNRWDVLDPNASADTVATESVDGLNVTTMVDQTYGSLNSSSQGVSIRSSATVAEEAVDDWEEAYQ